MPVLKTYLIGPKCDQPDFVGLLERADYLHPQITGRVVDEMGAVSKRQLDLGVHAIRDYKSTQGHKTWGGQTVGTQICEPTGAARIVVRHGARRLRASSSEHELKAPGEAHRLNKRCSSGKFRLAIAGTGSGANSLRRHKME